MPSYTKQKDKNELTTEALKTLSASGVSLTPDIMNAVRQHNEPLNFTSALIKLNKESVLNSNFSITDEIVSIIAQHHESTVFVSALIYLSRKDAWFMQPHVLNALLKIKSGILMNAASGYRKNKSPIPQF